MGKRTFGVHDPSNCSARISPRPERAVADASGSICRSTLGGGRDAPSVCLGKCTPNERRFVSKPGKEEEATGRERPKPDSGSMLTDRLMTNASSSVEPNCFGYKNARPVSALDHSSIASQFQERAQRLLRFDNTLQDPTAVSGAI